MEKATEKKNNVYRLSKNGYGSNSSSILLAEDDEEMRKLLAFMLRKEGYRVTECSDGLSLLDMLSSFFLPGGEHKNFNLVISDIRMPGITGMEIMMGANEIDNFPPIILITAFGDKETHMLAERFGAAALFDKPFDIDEMLKKVASILLDSA
jgi:DNA-binding response OmpR family regulator